MADLDCRVGLLARAVLEYRQVPCISVPFGDGPQSLPPSVQLIGPMDADDTLLAAAKWVHRQLMRIGGYKL
ncbi:MAG: hypothetical protein O6932_01215 [Gammaproteobacteria bacterium]|nr:hypothetical protein [Gammaproteobacteria bacterium]